MSIPFLLQFPLLLLGMKFLLGLLFHKVLELIPPLGPYIFLTRKLLCRYIVRLKRTLHPFGSKGILFAYCSSLRGNLHVPSSSLVYVVYRNGMRRVSPSIWLSLVMGDHALSMFLGRYGPYIP